MLKIALIRPGTTDYDLQERIQGTLDIPLNEQGLAEAAQAAEELRDKGLEVIYAPPSEPAFRTAQTISENLDIKMRKLDRLQNLNYGLWQGMLIKDVRRKQPKVYRQWQEQPEHVCPPEGEMLEAADQRVRLAMMKLLKRHKDGMIGVCVPEPLLSLVRRFIAHGELGDLWKPTNGHSRVEILQVEPEEVLVKG
ncbi:MAG: histidine phosphatase family protein [Thermoguttaceae bacterium]|jgi:probable phosphoglycerate mutase